MDRIDCRLHSSSYYSYQDKMFIRLIKIIKENQIVRVSDLNLNLDQKFQNECD